MDQQEKPEIPEILKALLERLKPIIQSSPQESYNCEKCHDSTWVDVLDEDGVARKTRCSCYRIAMAKRMVERSGLSEFIEKKTFDSFVTTNPIQQQIKQKGQEYLETLLREMDNKSQRLPWFYIGGNPGSGKTHICTAICGELLKRSIGVKYMQWAKEIARLKYTNDDDFDDLASEYLNAPVLYVDDLLKQKYSEEPSFTNADVTTAFKILDIRYALNRPTIISCEWDLVNQLIAYADEAVFSRVYERCRGFMINIGRKIENNYRMTGG